MRKEAVAILSALLFGCSTSAPHFVKLDTSGKIEQSTDAEALERALADCKVTAEQVKADEGVLFGRGGARTALENCMRSKGYVKS
jgi:hypothetical protein